MRQQLSVALVGYGLAGRVFHAPLIEATDDLRLVSVVTASPERAAQVRADHPHADVVTDVAHLLHDADEYDLLVVATANAAHERIARAGLRRGLHVLVDKPLARDVHAARALAEEARHHHRQLHVFQNRRWDSDFRTLRALVEDGALGRVHRLESRFERWRPAPRGVWRESADPNEMGGLLYDLGAHLVDQAMALLGPVDAVYAELRSVREPGAADDDTFVALTHTNGAVSHLWASSVAAARGPRFRVLGTRGAYVVDDPDSQEERLRSGNSPGNGWGEEPPERWGRLEPGAEVVPSLPGAWPDLYRQLALSLRGRAQPPVDLSGVIAATRVLDAARESARTHRVVALAGA
jgi:scyllo-inositol 2-dehydrogenase (NADP+)